LSALKAKRFWDTDVKQKKEEGALVAHPVNRQWYILNPIEDMAMRPRVKSVPTETASRIGEILF
jgi:hypothetical protein